MSAATLDAQMADRADSTLLRDLHLGDERAFEELFTRYYPRVYAVALRLMADPDDAEDLAQEVFVRLYRHPLHPGGDANVAGWLFRVVTNQGFNTLRSRRRRQGWLGKIARLRPYLEAEEDPQDIVASRDEAREVREALAGLPERQRMVLVLRASGVSYSELAAALRVKPGSVGTILARAEEALRKAYSRDAALDRKRGRS